jgi:predicted DNA-binding protein with PD1-like motif
MTRFDIIMGKNIEKKEKKKISIILDEDDDVLKSIEKGLKENNVKSAEITSINGFLKEGLINSINEGKIVINNAEIIKASGKFKFGGDDLWGKMNVFTGNKKPLTGQLLKGIAKQDFEITLEY